MANNAQTVANNALAVAKAAGFKPTLLYDRGSVVSSVSTETLQLSESAKDWLIIEYFTYDNENEIDFGVQFFKVPLPSYSLIGHNNLALNTNYRVTNDRKGAVSRTLTINDQTINVSQAFVCAGSGTTANETAIVNRIWTI